MRALRDGLRARLEQQEDYRAWKALDDTLRDLDPPMPRAVGLVVQATFGSVRSVEAEVDDGLFNLSTAPLV
jgi:hypothetical protein